MANVDGETSFPDFKGDNSTFAGFREAEVSFPGPDPAGFQYRDKKRINPGLEIP
jgi:hypothetical protein